MPIFKDRGKKISPHNGDEGKSETDSDVEVVDDLLDEDGNLIDESTEEKPKGRKAKPKKLPKGENSGTVTSQKAVDSVSEKGDVSDGNAERREGVGNLPQTQRGEQERPGVFGIDRDVQERTQDERILGDNRILSELLVAKTTKEKIQIINSAVNDIREHLGLGSFEVEIASATSFYESQLDAQKTNPYKGFVDVKTPEDLEDCLILKVKGAYAGLAIKPDGDIVALHKDSNSGISDFAPSMVIIARALGGIKMDNYEFTLLNMVIQCLLLTIYSLRKHCMNFLLYKKTSTLRYWSFAS